MKKSIFYPLFLLVFFLVSQQAMAQGPEKTRVLLADSTQLLAYPLDVMGIITNKCLGCHSPDAKNEKSRDALQWIALQEMEPADLVAKLDEVTEVLEEGSMPPEKILERYPHLKLTEEETALLKAWAEATLNTAMGE